MFAHCSGPIWRHDDFTQCFQHDFLLTLLPLILCAISLIYLAVQLAFVARGSKYYKAYKIINRFNSHIWDYRVPQGEGETVSIEEDEDEDEDEPDSDEDPIIKSSKRRASVLAVDRPRGEVVLPLIEEFAVLAELGIHIAQLVTHSLGRHGHVAAIAGIAVWSYVSVLTSMRLFFTASSRFSFPRLWYHTAFLYCFLWLTQVFVFWSQVTHPQSQLTQALVSSNFALVSLLAIIALTSRRGNKAVELEYIDNLDPSREPLASTLSLATFSWVDAIVWKGYRKTYELVDVWNLVAQDKAAAILADYRQLKKTSALAFHLLKYFKTAFLLQAAWGVLFGINTFVPTLLLKVILEYVEDPQTISSNAAWLYVILLFVSGLISALAGGQGLWIGRKVCIRLRAIIIGELYAKALRRRAAASADKALGQTKKKTTEENAKPGLWQRLTGIFSKKQKDDKAPPKTPEADSGEGQVTSGAIINLMAVDSFKISEVSAYLHLLWAETPTQFILSVVLLYQLLGYSSIAGIGMMIVLAPINIIISKQFSICQKLILAATDARIHTTNEVLTNIRIIKYFAWEQRFLAQVDEKRSTELKHLRRRYIVWSFAAMIWTTAPIMISFLTFLVYTMVEHRDLIPSVAFTALSLFSILRAPLDQLADMIAHVQEAKVSVDRVEEYLNEPETDKYRQLEVGDVDDDGKALVGFDNATFSWGGSDSDDDFKMIDLNLRFKVGDLNVIVGPTGSGKTSLLMALLGEMSKLDGEVYLPGARSREEMKADPETGLTESVAYCAQQAWLVNGSIKENILFASAYDARRYKDVIVACSLQRDLEILDAGDQTLVGEKGVTLSGGQKQRISLARALYCRAKHILLDDVLSAVDAHTAKWIFDKAIMGPLMYHRTCILVTHNSSLCLPHAGFAVVLDNGRVTAQGNATEVIDSGKLGEDLLKSRPASRGASALPSRVQSEIGVDGLANGHAEPNGHADRSDRRASVKDGDELARVISHKQLPGMNADTDATIPTETKAVGRVSIKLIFMYLASMGGIYYWIITSVVFGLQQIVQVATNVWIREWANAYAARETAASTAGHRGVSMSHYNARFDTASSYMTTGSFLQSLPFSHTNMTTQGDLYQAMDHEVDVNDGYYLGIYALLGIACMLITFFRLMFLFYGSLTASRRIHRKLINAIAHAQFRFFDSTPLGQLMNRFSKDIELVDQEIAPVAEGVVHCLASIVTIIILISVITPDFLIAGFFICIIYFLIGSFYINSSRDLKRLESVQRSPLYQQFGETLSGMTTIRAYGDERRFLRDNISKINTHSRPFIYLWAANRWLAFRVDVTGALVSFFTGMFVILSVGRVDAGAAGLALTYAVSFTENVLWFVRLYSVNEQNMNAVERIKEYYDVDQEAASIMPNNRPPANWPSKGSVEFIGYSTRYRKDFDFVLKQITFRIGAGEKVGVVGRTGAGKSSLALALFRALEAEEGKILVDDVDVGLIGLQDLREAIVMVPQDPTLFTGSIRSNLDPFGLFTDEEIYTALRRVQLIGAATATPSRPSTPVGRSAKGSPTANDSQSGSETPSTAATAVLENKNIFKNLKYSVAESGSNLSQGQRQLLCLARALLKAPSVLLMDEATASIDYATDSKIQGTIREFKNTTITIAHRLQTIIDYDKVLVLDKGEVIEYGDPWDLLQKEEGIFKGMCEMSGDYPILEKEAKKAFEGRRLVDVDAEP